jgi:hypothetical protein
MIAEEPATTSLCWRARTVTMTGAMRKEKCHDCGIDSPATNTEYTLISSRYGWRVVQARDAKGEIVMEWRCPTCWKEFKLRPPSPDPSTASPRKQMVRSTTGRIAAVEANKAFEDALGALRDKEKKR